MFTVVKVLQKMMSQDYWQAVFAVYMSTVSQGTGVGGVCSHYSHP